MTNFTDYEAKASDTQKPDILIVRIPSYFPFSSPLIPELLTFTCRLSIFQSPDYQTSAFPPSRLPPISTLPYIPSIPAPGQIRG